jgi:D-alanine-D-alanine ligase
MSHLTRVGVLRGGPSNEYEVSLNTGAGVLRVLRDTYPDRYAASDILIDRDGLWHCDGAQMQPNEVLPRIDVAVNALHGTYGEDGTVQTLFETHGLPFTGSGSLGSAVGMNKALTKKILKDHGLKTPYGIEIESSAIETDADSVCKRLFHGFLLPAVVKPTSSGSSVGVTVVTHYNQLPQALKQASAHGDSVLVEELVRGVEATCGVVQNFRGQELYALPPIEIRPLSQFFDYEAKYRGLSEEIVPATFSQTIKNEIENLARTVHSLLGLRHYSRSDFIIHPRRGIYVLEVNTLPGLTEESLMPKALRAIGSDTHEFIDHIIGLALGR